jgi:hypothetical protein
MEQEPFEHSFSASSIREGAVSPTGFELCFSNELKRATEHAFLPIRFAGRGFGSKEVIYVKPRESPTVDLNFGDILETRAI